MISQPSFIFLNEVGRASRDLRFDFERENALLAQPQSVGCPMNDAESPNFFEQLVQNHYQDLYRFAFSLAKRQEDASDLVQQVFTIWAQKGHQLLDRTKAKSWLFTTLHREFLSRHRRAQAGPQLVQNEEINLEEMVSIEPAMEREIDGKKALRVLEELEDPFGPPMRLFYLSDMNYREIAETLSVPIGTIMSRLSRGKMLLREKLEAPDRS